MTSLRQVPSSSCLPSTAPPAAFPFCPCEDESRTEVHPCMQSLGRLNAATGRSRRARNHGIRLCRSPDRRRFSDSRIRSGRCGDAALRIARRTRGKIVLEAGTFGLELKERVRECLEGKGARVLDAPVSGTGSQAQKKDLVFFASGERDAFDRVAGVLRALARDVRYVGPFGNGSKLKYIANLLVTIHNLSAAEAIVLGERAGIPADMVLEVLGNSAATSRMFQVRGPMMASRTYEPATMRLEVYQKDIEIIDGFAKSLHCPTPLFSASTPYYERAIERGRGNQDTAAIVTVLREAAGLSAD